MTTFPLVTPTPVDGQPYPYPPAADPLLLPPPLTWLRTHRPVVRVETGGSDPVWLVTRYDDVRAVLGDVRFSRNMARDDVAELIPGVRMPSSPIADPPAHTRWRTLVDQGLHGAPGREGARPPAGRRRRPARRRRPPRAPRGPDGNSSPSPSPLSTVCTMLGLGRRPGPLQVERRRSPVAERHHGAAEGGRLRRAGGHRRGRHRPPTARAR